MKTKVTLLFILLSFNLFSQNGGFNYKALITEDGNTLSNQSVTIRFTIVQQSPVYTETINTTTDENGIVSVTFGECDINEYAEEFCNINWQIPSFLKVEIDTGNGYLDFGTNAFHYVPFAKYAVSGGSVKSLDDLADAKSTPEYGSVFIGTDAGSSENLSGDVEANIGIGKDALKSVSTGHRNLAIGTSALKDNNGQGNIAIGNFTLAHGTASNNNTVVGIYAFANNFGSNNVALGCSAGINNFVGSGNIFLGYHAGYNERGSNKLYIDNSSTETPLIGGDFDMDEATINGKLNINNDFSATDTFYVINNRISDSGSGGVYMGIGLYNEITGTSTGVHYGVKNVISAGNTTAPQYGTYNEVNTTGSAYKYGTYNLIPETNFGYGIAVYGEALGENKHAGYFKGDVTITNNLKIEGGLPGVGKVLTSDADGLASWQTPSATNSLWETNGTDVYRSTGKIGIGTSTPAAPLEIKSNTTPSLIIRSTTTNNADRPGIQFANNTSQYISGDDASDEIFGFYSRWSSTRTYNAKLRVYGKATGSWGRYVEITHDGTDGTIKTDAGNLTIAPAGNEVKIDGKITSTISKGTNLKTYAYGTIHSTGPAILGSLNFNSKRKETGIYSIRFVNDIDGNVEYNFTDFTTVATAIGMDEPLITVVDVVNGFLIISVYNLSGNLTDSAFSFVTYKK
jgi:hypothetical protein